MTGAMLCDQGFRADGPVNLGFARIGTGLSFKGAHLNGKDGAALIGTRLTVTGEHDLRWGHHCRAESS